MAMRSTPEGIVLLRHGGHDALGALAVRGALHHAWRARLLRLRRRLLRLVVLFHLRATHGVTEVRGVQSGPPNSA
jgi:hypothetical protein